jgi:predicted O-linked N-acetylglucosamine transferase (SPINDLY family)
MKQKISNITEAIQSAFNFYQQGKLQKAENICNQILKLDPDNIHALHLKGLIISQTADDETGVMLIRKAIDLKKDYGDAYFSLGNIYSDRNFLDKAIRYYQKALSYKPSAPEIYFNLGNVYKNKEQFDEATTQYLKAISLKPNYVKAYINLGIIYKEKGAMDQVIESYRMALSFDQNSFEALNNLGDMLRERGLIKEAGNCLTKALSINPNSSTVCFNIGKLMEDKHHLEKAIIFYRKAIKLKPDYVEAYNNLGYIYIHLMLPSKAESIFKKIISIQPDYALAHNNLAGAFKDLGRLDEAVGSYRKALNLKQDYFKAHSNLLFSLNYFSHFSQEEIFKESMVWDEQHAKRFMPGEPKFDNSLDRERKLRIGYLSPDFRSHPVANFIEPVILAHDRENFEVFCYADEKRPDEVTKRIRSMADKWFSLVGKNDSEVLEQIKRDSIDILVDLAGHSGDNRLNVFAHKPAPIQISWIGYPNTTGLEAMDYRFTDAVADPVGDADSLHSEKLVRLEHGFLCYQPEASAPEVARLPCLKQEYVTFGSFNNLIKSTPEVIKVWSRILQAIPDSTLLLKAKQLEDNDTRERYLKMFTAEGISLDRIELFGLLPKKEDHLALYNKVDIGLDPFPYNGTTTTCEAMWMGVPVITLRGERHAGRVGASLLHRVGLDEMVADSIEEYIQIAQDLANDLNRLKTLRETLRSRMQNSTLMDCRLFVKALEDEYRRMWHVWCDNSQE